MPKPETSGPASLKQVPGLYNPGGIMAEAFNIFTEVSSRHLLAYIDRLAKADAEHAIGEPLSEEICKDPFTLKIDFLKRELGACKDSNERLLRERQAGEAAVGLAAAMVHNMRQELDFVRESCPANVFDAVDVLGALNPSVTWLMGKFHLSRNVPFFRGENVFSTGADPRILKESAWFMYLSAINVSSMSQILDVCQNGLRIVADLPEAVSPFFGVLEGLNAYFYSVIDCLDSLAHVERGSLSRLPDLTATPPADLACGGLKDFLHLLDRCRQQAHSLVGRIRKRHYLFLWLFAIVYSSFPDPDYQKTAELFKKRGAINDFIQSSKI